MKKMLTACALIALGSLSAFAAPKKEKFTGTLTNGKKAHIFYINTESGDKVRALAWGKMQKKLKPIVKEAQESTFTVSKNKSNHYIIKKFTSN